MNYFGLDLLCAIVSSTLICLIYALLMLSVPILRKKEITILSDNTFKSKIPNWSFVLLGIILLGISIVTPLTIVEEAKKSVIVTLVIILLGFLLAIRMSKKDYKRKIN